jgi:hypothetical protein
MSELKYDKIEIEKNPNILTEIEKKYFDCHFNRTKPVALVMGARIFYQYSMAVSEMQLLPAMRKAFEFKGVPIFINKGGFYFEFVFSPDDASRFLWEESKK